MEDRLSRRHSAGDVSLADTASRPRRANFRRSSSVPLFSSQLYKRKEEALDAAKRWFNKLEAEVEDLNRRPPSVAAEEVDHAQARLTELLGEGSLRRVFVGPEGGFKAAILEVNPPCDVDELMSIAQVLERWGNHFVALQLRMSLVMNSTSIDTTLMANLDALTRLNTPALSTMGKQLTQDLVVHCRALYALARLLHDCSPKVVHKLGEIIIDLEICWQVDLEPADELDRTSLRMNELQTRRLLRSPSSSSDDRRRSGDRGSFGLQKFTPHRRHASRLPSLSNLLGTGADPVLERAFTRWVEEGVLRFDVSQDGEGECAVRRIWMKSGCLPEVAAKVAGAASSIEGELPFISLLLTAAQALNAISADDAFVLAIRSMLRLKARIEAPAPSLWIVLSDVYVHAVTLKTLGFAPVPDSLQSAIDALSNFILVDIEQLPLLVHERATNLMAQHLTLGFDVGPGLLKMAEIEAKATRQSDLAHATRSLTEWGIEPKGIGAFFARSGALEAFARLLLARAVRPRLERGKFGKLQVSGFDVLHPGKPTDVVEVASAFVHAQRGDIALQLLASHWMHRLKLTRDDLPCLSSFVRIAKDVDVTDELAMKVVHSVVLHGRLLLRCGLSADTRCDRAWQYAENSLMRLLRARSDEANDAMAAGDVDGICHLLDDLTGDSHSDARRDAIVGAAAKVAAAHGGARLARIRRSVSAPLEESFEKLLGLARTDRVKRLRDRLPLSDEEWRGAKAPDRSMLDMAEWSEARVQAVIDWVNAQLDLLDGVDPAINGVPWLLSAHAAADTTWQLGDLLALALGCAARAPEVLKQKAFFTVLVKLLSDDQVVDAMLQGDVTELPAVMFALAVGQSGTLDRKHVWNRIQKIHNSVEFASAMASASGHWILDDTLMQVCRNPLWLEWRATRAVLRAMLTQSACRGSLRAVGQPILRSALAQKGARIGQALIECLLLLDLPARKAMADGLAKVATEYGILETDGKRVAQLVVVPIVPRRRYLATHNPPAFVLENEGFLATWLGTGVADCVASDGVKRLLPLLAEVLRRQRKDVGKGQRESPQGLAFAVRLAMRAAMGQTDELLDSIALGSQLRESGKRGHSELFAHASLVAQCVLRRRRMPHALERTEVALLAHLMCASLMLDIQDAPAGLDHLHWVESREAQVESFLLSSTWFTKIRGRLHTELHALTA